MSMKIQSVRTTRIDVQISEKAQNSRNLDVTIKTEIGYTDEELERALKIVCEITDKTKQEDDIFKVAVEVVGHFLSDAEITEDDNEMQKILIKELFPYVRANISTVTAITGITTINLPTFDL